MKILNIIEKNYGFFYDKILKSYFMKFIYEFVFIFRCYKFFLLVIILMYYCFENIDKKMIFFISI